MKPERAAEIAALVSGFLSVAPQGVGRAEDLAEKLAFRSRLLRDALAEELVRQEKEHRQGRLFGLLQAFRAQVSHDLSIGGLRRRLRPDARLRPLPRQAQRRREPGRAAGQRAAVHPRLVRADPRAGRLPRRARPAGIRRHALDRRRAPLHRERARPRGDPRGSLVPPAQGDQPQAAREGCRGAPAVRARPVHLFLRGLPQGLRPGDAQGARGLLHAPSGGELHRARGR